MHRIANMKIKNITIISKFPILGKELNNAEIASLRPLCLANSLKGLSTLMTLNDLIKPRSIVLKITEIVAETTITKSRIFHAFLM